MSSIQKEFYLACHSGHLDVVKYLVSVGADITADDNYAVRWASLYGHLDVVKYLVSVGTGVTMDSNWAVRWASYNGDLEIVKYLVSIGADVTMENNYAVRWASHNDHLQVVEFLLSKGADFNELTPKHKIYFKQKRAYSRWRRIYLRKWIRKVLIPLYYSPKNPGGIQAKKELEMIF